MTSRPYSPATGLPTRSGLGFKPQHFASIREGRHDVGFFEVHAENFMGAGGPPLRMLEAIRADHALSIHGVGLSIGHPGPLDRDHLKRLARLVDRFHPEAVSEHLAWSSHGAHFADLLPFPLNSETLEIVVAHVDEVQTRLRRRMLLENPSTYVLFSASDVPEVEFLETVARRTGCGLLLDVANVDVSATNHGFAATAYLDAFPLDLVEEIHLAGRFETTCADGLPLFVDAHGSPVADPVWRLYERVIARTGPMPTLLEWDNDVPAFDVLAAEGAKAEAILRAHGRGREKIHA